MLSQWLQHIEFAYPWVLGLLLLVPVWIYEYLRRFKKGQAAMLVTTLFLFSKPKASKRPYYTCHFFYAVLPLYYLL